MIKIIHILFPVLFLLIGSCATISLPNYLPEIVCDEHTAAADHITYELLDAKEKRKYTYTLYKELQKYPIEYFNRVNLKKIFLVKNLRSDNHKVAGLVDLQTNFIFISIGDGDYDIELLKNSLHHEMNHNAEFVLWHDYNYNWAAYESLYNESVHDTKAIREEAGIPQHRYIPALRGFLNIYSTQAPWEDRSEIIAYYMTDSYHHLLIEKSKIDALFHKKAMLLLMHYEENFGFSNLVATFLEERENYTF
jgi:hypothetical protein